MQRTLKVWMSGAALAIAAQGGIAQAQYAPSAPVQAQAPAYSTAGQYSPRLMIYYRLVPYGNGYGARLTQPPLPGSPLAQPQIALEPGDMITHLDGTPITTANELETHVDQTSVQFVNIRNNQRQVAWATLPSGSAPNPNPGPFPPPAPNGPYVLGVVTVPVMVNAGQFYSAAPGVAATPATNQALRVTSVTPGSAAERAGLRPGDTILTAGQYTASDPGILRAAIGQSGGVLPLTVLDGLQNTRSLTAYLGGFPEAASPLPYSVARPPFGSIPPGYAPAPRPGSVRPN